MGATENCLEAAINEALNRTYAKLVLADDASTPLGGVLVGDASCYGVPRPMVGRDLPGDPLALIAPADTDSGATDLGVGALPDSAQICSCNNVTKGNLKCAIADGCGDVAGLKSCTAAGTSCGSCVPLQTAPGSRGCPLVQGAVRALWPFARGAFRDHFRHRDLDLLGPAGALRPRKGLRNMQTRCCLDPGLHRFRSHPRR